MAAEPLLRPQQVHITAVGVPVFLDGEVHRLAVDGDAVVLHFDVIARQAHQALDEVGRRVHGPAEHHHVAALRLADVEDLAIDHRQAQPVGVLVDDDEVAVEERGHHGIGGNPERLEDEGAQQQHHQGDRKEAARVVDRPRLGHSAWVLAGRAGGGGAPRAQQPHVQRPHQTREERDRQQHRAEIQPLREQQAQHRTGDQHRQRAVQHPHQWRVAPGLRAGGYRPPWAQQPVIDDTYQRHRQRQPGQKNDQRHQRL